MLFTASIDGRFCVNDTMMQRLVVEMVIPQNMMKSSTSKTKASNVYATKMKVYLYNYDLFAKRPNYSAP